LNTWWLLGAEVAEVLPMEIMVVLVELVVLEQLQAFLLLGVQVYL
jgi:hypothetical protein